MINILKLSDGKTKKAYKIVSLNGSIKNKRRLLELGFVKGTSIQILKISHKRFSFLLQIRRFVIALRCSEVENIICEEL